MLELSSKYQVSMLLEVLGSSRPHLYKDLNFNWLEYMHLKKILFLLLTINSVGCYKTTVNTGLEPVGDRFEQRQWFVLNGDIPLTDPIGEECAETGLAYSESGKESGDIWIDDWFYFL